MIMSIHINFSEQEVNAEARSYEALPTGEYKVAVTDVDLKEVTAETKNKGKPFYNVEMTVQEGKYEGSKLWGTVMLFEGAAYSISQIMKTMGRTPGQDDVPNIEELTGHKMTCVVLNTVDQYQIDKAKKAGQTLTDTPRKAEVKGYKPWGAASAAPTGSTSNGGTNAGKVSGGMPLP